jgi:hypothetical protein
MQNSLPPLKIRVTGDSTLTATRPKKIRVKFAKYPTLSKYYEDYYSSDDDDEVENIAETAETESKIDLTKLVQNIKSLDDLIGLCEKPSSEFKPCNRGDLIRLKNIKHPIEELNRLIGMDGLKNKFIYQALFYCQDLHKIKPSPDRNIDDDGDLMHTVIQGDPGSGKTTVAKIIGKFYLKLGILKSDKFIVAKRKDLIAEYLGQTAPKTTKVLESALGGVLFIDEAYALGNEDKQDIFSKECIDTINQFLTEHKRDLVLIIAGYRNDLQSCFFGVNQGLARRFPWIYDIEKYTDVQLQKILIKQITESGWGFAENDPQKVIPLEFMKANREYFNFAGGDTEVFVKKCKLAHGRNTFGLPMEKKGLLTHKDIIKGMEIHKENKKNQSVGEKPPPEHMYI